MDDSSNPERKPPYGSFQTFWSFIDSLGTKELPPFIDRSMLDGKSGSDQIGIFMALRAFRLIEGENNKVQPLLISLAKNASGRKAQLAELVREFYREALAVSAQHGTEKMLLDSFTDTFGLTGDTRRKAATFFLHAARESGILVSEHFPKTRTGPGAAPGSRARRTVKRKAQTPLTPPPRDEDQEPKGTADEFTVQLRAGGTVTLRVTVGQFALARHKGDREFVQKLVDALIEYEEGRASDQSATEVGAGSTPASQPTEESTAG